MTTPLRFNFGGAKPRRNLPYMSSSKRGEANFVGAFERAYLAQNKGLHIGGREFEVPGFGIADLVWINLRYDTCTIENILTKLPNQRLRAFEMKLRDWRQALQQAYRYSYFADQSIVVIPLDVAQQAKAFLKLFRDLRIGLWAFDMSSNSISRIHTPRGMRARNTAARTLAFDLISRKVNLCKLEK
ncbi:MAG: hypothetical protein M1434_09655 [Chloroflexi bacterium]|nr:hypothetical protein [Chloroflexota bacterium]MCL5274989.1 hypothetical protein [Chloroflexota bacterium]